MISLRGAAVLLVLSLIALAGSQVLVKWRFQVLGLDGPGARTFGELLPVIIRDGGIWAGGLLLLGGACAWYLALTRLPISFMLPVAALAAPMVAISAYFLLGEPLSAQKMSAIVLIAAGAAWLGVLSS